MMSKVYFRPFCEEASPKLATTMRPTLLAALACLASCGCASASRFEVRANAPWEPARGVIFVVDGAGDFGVLSDRMRQLVAEENLPLSLESSDWSHGFSRVFADQVDYCHARAEGCKLAGRIAAFRAAHPDTVVYVVSYSAGVAVALAAAENLPPDTLDRMILLAPAVSADYDLRCALRSCRQGIDAFVSSRDRVTLGIAVTLFGTTDRQRTPAAGRVGFRPVIATPEDARLYGKLFQHSWDPCMRWTGNTGNHVGACRPEFLRAYVVPLL
jgi:hypothetical protein